MLKYRYTLRLKLRIRNFKRFFFAIGIFDETITILPLNNWRKLCLCTSWNWNTARTVFKKFPSLSTSGILACFLLFFSFYTIESQASCPNIQVCFTPGQDCTKQITDVLDTAKRSIFVQAYSFTSTPIAKHLVKAKKRGVVVKVILDKSQRSQSYSSSRFLLNQHIPVWIDYKPAIAHNKIMIVDEKEIITGSFNFTKAAQFKNAENLLIIQDPTLAKRYMENWQRRKVVSEILDLSSMSKKHKVSHHQSLFAFKF